MTFRLQLATLRGRLSRVLVCALALTPLAAQQPAVPPTDKPPQPARDRRGASTAVPERRWLERAEWLTLEIREEEWRLGPERTLLLARLAETWWRYDAKRARAWMDSAVDELEFQPQNEGFEDTQARIAIAESVLPVAMRLDRSYVGRLLKVITEGIEQAAENATTVQEKIALSRLAMELPELMRVSARNQDFASADRIYRTLLKIKDANHLGFALGLMWAVNPDYAAKLYAGTLVAVRTDYEPAIMFALAEIAFPRYAIEQSLLPSDLLRRQFLDLLSAGVLRVPRSKAEQIRVCNLWGEAERLLSYYPAHRAGAMQAVIDDCRARLPIPMRETAEFEANAWRTAFYKSRVAERAYDKGDLIRALEILARLTKEEQEAYPQWVSEYQKYELDATEALYKRHDYPGLQQIMDNSPRRPQTLLAVAQVLFDHKDESFGMAILAEARRAMEKTQVDEPLFYWLFLDEYSEHVPSETAAILKQAVLGLNGIRPAPPDAGFYWTPLSMDFRSLSISPKILDLEPEYVTATIKLLDSPQERTAFRLNVLRAALKRYEREKKS